MVRSQHLPGVVVGEDGVGLCQLPLQVSWQGQWPSTKYQQGNPVCVRQLTTSPEALGDGVLYLRDDQIP